MSTRDEDRPKEWGEREEAGAFVAWVPPRPGAVRELGIAALMTLPAVAFPFVFDHIPKEQRILGTLVFAIVALVLWRNAWVEQLPRATFRVEGGRLTLGQRPVPSRTVSFPVKDIAAVRPVSRAVAGKNLNYELWDLEFEMRKGPSQRIKLSWVPPKEAAWMARRVADAAGV